MLRADKNSESASPACVPAALLRRRDIQSPGRDRSDFLPDHLSSEPRIPPVIRLHDQADPLSLLVVDCDQSIIETCRQVALSMGFFVLTATNLADAEALIKHDWIDIMLLDLPCTEDRDGLHLLEEFTTTHSRISVVVMSTYATVSNAVRAMQVGARNYLTKPFEVEELTALLYEVRKLYQIDTESLRLHERLRTQYSMGSIIGTSSGMEKLYGLISRVACSTHPVLILGETGTGKEMVAKQIHLCGARASKPFVPIDCSALVPTLVESELFGHVKGAFTGAAQAKEGLFVAANGGTVFLDEIGELPLDLQSKLLRALQEKEVRPVGANYTVPITARVVAATNRHLRDLVEEGRFRKDLYFRLNVVTLKVPPLRERGDDILLLATYFLDQFNRDSGRNRTFHHEALRVMSRYDWPGNVRELENAVQRACALCSGPILSMGDLPSQVIHFWTHQDQHVPAIRDPHSAESAPAATFEEIVSIAEMEKTAILETIHTLHGDKLMAAKLLGIGKTTLYRKLKEYGFTDDEPVTTCSGGDAPVKFEVPPALSGG